MAKIEKMYRIRRKSDGKFSSGGAYPNFTTLGKTWKAASHLKSHITNLNHYHFERNCPFSNSSGTLENHPYIDCEIVEYEIIESNKRPVIDDEFNRTYIINTLTNEI